MRTRHMGVDKGLIKEDQLRQAEDGQQLQDADPSDAAALDVRVVEPWAG